MLTFRVLLVDDYEPFRRVVRSILRQRDDFLVIGEASDGLEAVHKAKQLQPDLIILDIGLPTLNGIQAARRLRDLVPHARILFLSEESFADVIQEGFRSGALGYVRKLNTERELLSAIDTVLKGKHFLGSGPEDHFSEGATDQTTSSHHDMLIYSDDAVLLDSVVRFIVTVLSATNPAIVVATQPHCESLVKLLKERGFDVDGAIEQATFILLDAVEMLSRIIVNGVPDHIAFFEGFGALIESAAKAASTEHPRVAIYGECCGLLYAEGNLNATIGIEKLGNDLARTHNIDILCAYPLLHGQEGNPAFKDICVEHSAISYR